MPVRALNQALLRFGNCLCPGERLRTLVRVRLSIDKAAPNELGDGRVKQIEFGDIFGRADGQAWRGSVWESAAGNPFFNRRGIAFSQPLCPEGVVAFHQQLENQNTQAKGILLRRADDAGKILTL